MKLVFIILCLAILAHAKPRNFFTKNCGYSSCPKANPNQLNIHIVPHSHDDVGWLKTVDQYFYGSENNIQHAGVQFILQSAIQALTLNPERRFIYVETAFFWKWWQQQNDKIKDQVRSLVNNGQLEFVGGAWSMNDEAATHYQSIIDQFTWGFKRLNDTLGKCAIPKIGWQIDPFGHSREQASLFAQFGFDGLFFGRLDYRDKIKRMESKTAEMIWQGSASLESSSDIFTSILYNLYQTPPGFCFDVMCSDNPIIDDEESTEYNAIEKAEHFLRFAETQADNYRSNNILITMGGDFHYQDSLSYFTNMDKLIATIRDVEPDVQVFYSTPSCYLKAVHNENLRWPVKTDDFFPYASELHAYWSGYYTSRPTSKRFERLGNNLLQVTKQLATLAFAKEVKKTRKLNSLREAMGIMQHHDAITGTEKQHVADDYHYLLHKAMMNTSELAVESLRSILGASTITFNSCLLLNISQCEHTELNDNFLLTIYNPLSKYVDYYVRLPVSQNKFQVYNSVGLELQTQIIPIFEMIKNIPGRNSSAKYELVFKAERIPPLGYKMFTVKSAPNLKDLKNNIEVNKNIIFRFSKNKKYESLYFVNQSAYVKNSFYYYNGVNGNNFKDNRSSGAYIFRPKEKEAIKLNIDKTLNYNGSIVQESHSKYNSWLGQIVRAYLNPFSVELTWIVGPIPVDEKKEIGKEIISRYQIIYTNNNKKYSGKSGSGEFYTDSNGREMIKRFRGRRPTFNISHDEPVAENYYPVTTKISLRNKEKNIQFSILTDRSQGGSSLKDNDIELMVHRRLLRDDAYGVGEALNEMAFGKGLVAVGTHYLSVEHINGSKDEPSAEVKEKQKAQEILLSPWIFITPISTEMSDLLITKNISSLEKSGLKTSLPDNIQILTLEPWNDNIILLRLEHILEKNDDLKYAVPITFNIYNMFTTFRIRSIKEMTLGANQIKSEVNRLHWETEIFTFTKNESYKSRALNDKMDVTLNPMEIKTFLIQI